MKNLTIGIVAEGPTDVILIEELVSLLLPGEHHFLLLQPDLSETPGFGVHGAGWKGVVAWCESIAKEYGDISFYMQKAVPVMDLLIIHVDGDIAREVEIECACPCPPVEDTVYALEKKIIQWLGVIEDLPDGVICCVPTDNTETWILAAYDEQRIYHSPPERYLECLHDPELIICQKPFKLLKLKEGKPKKTQVKYREELIPKVIQKWSIVKEICTQAKRFEEKLSTHG